MANYQPSQKILNQYAKVLVNFALNDGKGIKKGEVVQIVVPDVAKDLAREIRNEVLKAHAHPLLRLLPTGLNFDYYSLATDEHLTFFPKKFLKAKANLIDHQIGILADPFPKELSKIDPNKIIKSRDSKKKYREWLEKKENEGKFTWTLALWAVEAKAKEVGLSMKAYWDQIIKACFLDMEDPIRKWQSIFNKQLEIKKRLNVMPIDYLHFIGKDMDIEVKIGEKRIWKGGSGRNIPSFEIFTSPDWRGVNGWIQFNEPVYRYGNVIQDVRFEVKNGIIVKSLARKGNRLLNAMLKSRNANKFGEVSLTDRRMSRISHPMAETLFDENMGGKFGNTHLAIGSAYKDCYDGKAKELKKKDWKDLGFNESAEHTDFVSTTDRTVTAMLTSGTKKVIYKDGVFVV